jgi:transcription elongation GreA/GreB family factor
MPAAFRCKKPITGCEGEHRYPKTEIKMIQRTLSRAALEADKAFKPAEPETTEYARTQQAFQDNRERLKMERLAREATVKR